MVYIREFEFFEDEGMVCVFPFGIVGGTVGYDLEDAVMMASDWLRIHVLAALERGEEFPQGSVGNKPSHGGTVIAVAVEASMEDVTKDAAERGDMEDTGMSDLQFKSFLKQLVGRLEDARDAGNGDAIGVKLEDIIQDLNSDIEG